MRKIEFVKKSEARILVYLSTAIKPLRHGGAIRDRLCIDYIYIMKLLTGMYNKGWLKTHQYEQKTYFEVTDAAPLETAKNILTDGQMKIKMEGNDNDRREIEKSCMEAKRV